MLSELFIWAGVSASPAARRLGYAKAAVSLWSRHRRCAKMWREHEANSRDFVLQIAADCRQRDTFWVLGAGTLADVPIRELSDLFRRVLIFDIAWLASARRRVRHFSNVELRQVDVTGLVDPLVEWQAGMPLPIPSQHVLQDLDAVPPDGIVSLNLLSQLPLLPMEYARGRGVTRAAADAFGRRIIEAHLAALSAFDCPVGLVADAVRIWRSRAGEVVMQESALLEVPLPVAEREWYWPVAPRGEIDPEVAMEIRVQAIRLATSNVASARPASFAG